MSLPRIELSSRALEVLKWLALVAMTLDHVNKYLLASGEPWMFAVGRIAMPIFALVLAYQLARPGLLDSPAFLRMSARLASFGLLACIPYIMMGREVGAVVWGWWPLNILLTLLCAAWCVKLLAAGSGPCQLAAAVLFAAGGAVVEFWWPGLGLVICAWSYARQPSPMAAIGVCLCLFLLGLLNTNQWAFMALPLIAATSLLRGDMPRWRYTFYGYYLAHLVVLWALMRAI